MALLEVTKNRLIVLESALKLARFKGRALIAAMTAETLALAFLVGNDRDPLARPLARPGLARYAAPRKEEHADAHSTPHSPHFAFQ